MRHSTRCISFAFQTDCDVAENKDAVSAALADRGDTLNQRKTLLVIKEKPLFCFEKILILF